MHVQCVTTTTSAVRPGQDHSYDALADKPAHVLNGLTRCQTQGESIINAVAVEQAIGEKSNW